MTDFEKTPAIYEELPDHIEEFAASGALDALAHHVAQRNKAVADFLAGETTPEAERAIMQRLQAEIAQDYN